MTRNMSRNIFQIPHAEHEIARRNNEQHTVGVLSLTRGGQVQCNTSLKLLQSKHRVRRQNSYAVRVILSLIDVLFRGESLDFVDGNLTLGENCSSDFHLYVFPLVSSLELSQILLHRISICTFHLNHFFPSQNILHNPLQPNNRLL